MKAFTLVIATIFFLLVSAGSKHDGVAPDSFCPLPQFKTLATFDVQKFTGSFYVQKAQESIMSPLSQLFCIRQQWSILNTPSSLSMDYEAREISAFGNHLLTPGFNASIFNPSTSAKISLGLIPGVSPSISSQPFWIFAASDTISVDGAYEWVIVINGSPTYESGSDRLCYSNGATSEDGKDVKDVGKGMWFMTRNQDGTGFINAMEQAAKSRGIDPTIAKAVVQDGCGNITLSQYIATLVVKAFFNRETFREMSQAVGTISAFLEDASVHKVYIGNLPWKCTDADLVDFFAPAGVVVKSIIGMRGPRPAGYAFVAFASAAEADKSIDLTLTMLLDRPVKINHATLKTPEELEQLKMDRHARRSEPREPREDRGPREVREPRQPREDRGPREVREPREPRQPREDRGPREVREPREQRERPARVMRSGEPEGEPSETTLYVGNLPWAVTDEDLADIFAEHNVVTANVVRMRGDDRNNGLGRSKGFGFVELKSKADQDAVMNELQNITVNDRQLIVKVAKQNQVARRGNTEE